MKSSQFCRTTTCGIQSGPDAFDESRFVITFLIILGVTEIFCSFRLVLKGKMGKEIPESKRSEFSVNSFPLSYIELLEKFLASNFALSLQKTTSLGC